MAELVMIPALGCDARLYQPVLPHLPAGLHVRTVIPDQPSFDACVSQVLAEAPDRFVLLGTSFGGRVAMELALAAPQRLQGLAVIGAGPGAVADPVAGRRRTARLRGGEFEDVIAEMAAIISHADGPNGMATRRTFREMTRAQGPELMARQSEALSKRTDLWPRLAEIQCPALMLWGVHDQFSPAADGLRLSAAVGKGRFVQIDACGHFPTLEYPEEAAAAICHWLADIGIT